MPRWSGRRLGVLLSFLLLLGLARPRVEAQTARDVAVEVSAVAEAAPPRITLQWLASGYGISLQKVYRRTKGATIVSGRGHDGRLERMTWRASCKQFSLYLPGGRINGELS